MTVWQKSREKCKLFALSVVLGEFSCGIVLLPVLLERGMFYEQFRYNIMID